MLDQLTTEENKEVVQKYVKDAANKSDLERTELQKTKSGVFLGTYATHPLTGEKNVPIWVADYVLGSYGTGSIMASPPPIKEISSLQRRLIYPSSQS